MARFKPGDTVLFLGHLEAKVVKVHPLSPDYPGNTYEILFEKGLGEIKALERELEAP